MKTEKEIRDRLEEVADFISIIGKQPDTMAVRDTLIWVLELPDMIFGKCHEQDDNGNCNFNGKSCAYINDLHYAKFDCKYLIARRKRNLNSVDGNLKLVSSKELITKIKWLRAYYFDYVQTHHTAEGFDKSMMRDLIDIKIELESRGINMAFGGCWK